MKVRIEVKSRRDAEAMRLALDDPEIRAFVLTLGYLKPLESDRARRRVLNFVGEMLAERKSLEERQP